jgi:hypothetical protein
MMLRRAPAAEMRGRTRGLQRRWNKNSGSRKQQQKSRDQALHVSSEKQNPISSA